MMLNQIIETLVRRERDNNNNHIRSSLQPRRGGYEYLDVLARLILGKEDVCAAVCCHHSGQLLYSNNRGKATDYAHNYLCHLKRFADDPQEARNYITLAEIAIERVLEVDSSRTGYGELMRFKDEVVNYKNSQNFLSNDKLDSLNTVHGLAQAVYDKIIEERRLANQERQNGQERKASRREQKANWAWDCLTPWHDLNTIANAIKNATLSQDLIKAIRGGNFSKIGGRQIMHAEMKLVNHLDNRNRHNIPRRYIGISKLACCPCQVTIDNLNRTNYFLNCGNCGTHGGTYPNWVAPNSLSRNELQEIENNLRTLTGQQMFPKARESTSQIPHQLTAMPIFSVVTAQVQQTI